MGRLSPQIVAKDAERALLDCLLQLSYGDLPWEVAILHGSQMNPTSRNILRLREANASISHNIYRTDITAYLCSDSDIFFLYPEPVGDIWSPLHAIVKELLPFLDPHQLVEKKLFTFHDVTHSYEHLFHMLRSKISLEEAYKEVHNIANTLKPSSLEHAPYVWDPSLFEKALTQRGSRKEQFALVIDDDSIQRQLAREVLCAEYGVVPAPDGYEGLALYNAYAPEIVFLDIDLPHLDGLSVLRMILQNDPDAIVVMFTADSRSKTLQQALSIGAKGFVTKPFSASNMLQHAKRARAAKMV